MNGCSRPTTVQEVKNEGVMHVITRVAPSIYYEGRDAPTGYDYELARRFADQMGVELRVRVAEDNSGILSVLSKNYAHIGMAGLSPRPDFEGKFRAVPIGVQAQSVVVYHRDYPRPSSLSDLDGETLHLLADSNHEHLIADDPDGAGIKRKVHPGLDAAGLLARVETGEIAYAAVSSNELDLNHVYFPMVKDGFALDEPKDLVWLFPSAQDDSLANAAAEFLSEAHDNGSMAQLAERFYGHLDRLNYVGARTFMHHVENRLPRYQSLFQDYASDVGLDWRLLAAIGYQESHWRPNAVSPTGVRGLMMLTRNTANYIGINNRLDPEESIEGGARYFRMVHAKIPERIPEPDRTWFALASYNVGFGHLEDARRLTQAGGKDPDRWMDVKEFLPLLAQKEWYTKTRFGYARGHEPVVYVQNIRRYYDVLTRITEPDQPAILPERELVSLDPSAEHATDSPPAEENVPSLRAALPPELNLIPPTL
ncbi:membrane-bound lytic murein transglycosylase MltF [Marinobacter sp.]|uniref:membrane-bound lytic murein transglycosylase MltF n=1 Tax=Marinobacter sp. TaxID=50741 RepID=UPI00345B836A